MPPTAYSRAGFSLIQLSIVLAVAAILLAATIPGQESGKSNQQIVTTVERERTSKQAIDAYKSRYKYIPCPADPTLPTSHASFGVESRVGSAGSACTAFYGMLPVRTLGLPDEYALDRWGRRLTYKVDTNAVTYNGCINLTAGTTAGSLAIIDDTTSAPSASAITCTNGTAAYKACPVAVLISHGKDGHGAYPAQGGSTRLDLGYAATYYNTLVNAFLTSPIIVQGAHTSTFDDDVEYIAGGATGCKAASTYFSNCIAPWGGTVVHGGNTPAYLTATVPYGNTCSSETRTCTNGTLSGSNTFQSCTVDPGASCVVAPFGTIAHGNSVTAYQSATSGNCAGISQSRTCTNGTLSGTYAFASCSAGSTCSLPWGGTINDGQSVTAYQSATGPVGANCSTIAQTRTCTSGSLSGTYTQQNCTNRACNLPWGGTIAHSASTTAYSAVQAWWPNTCGGGTTRTCNYGNLGGSGSYNGCTDFSPLMFRDQNVGAEYRVGRKIVMGDLDGDGLMDIVFSNLSGDPAGGGRGSGGDGSIYIMWGADPQIAQQLQDLPSPDNSYGITIRGEGTDHTFGYSLAMGDVDGDGITDLIVGAPTYYGSGYGAAGAAYVIWGRNDRAWGFGADMNMADLVGNLFAIRIAGTQDGSQFGYAVGAGNVTGQGHADLIVSALQYDNGCCGATGAVFILQDQEGGPLPMRNSGANELADQQFLDNSVGSRMDGKSPDRPLGNTIAVGNVNGDDQGGAYDDIIVSQQDNGTGPSLYVIPGNGDINAFWGYTEDGYAIEIAGSGDSKFGDTLAVSDINRDDVKDIIIGDMQRAWVIFGMPGLSNLGGVWAYQDGTNGFMIQDNSPDSNLVTVAAGGDVGGTGAGDIIVGSPYALNEELGATNAGRVYIVFGGGGGFNAQVDLPDFSGAPNGGVMINGARDNDQLGRTVAVSGMQENSGQTMNADGLSDIAIGRWQNDLITNGGVYLLYSVDDWGSGPYTVPEMSQ